MEVPTYYTMPSCSISRASSIRKTSTAHTRVFVLVDFAAGGKYGCIIVECKPRDLGTGLQSLRLGPLVLHGNKQSRGEGLDDANICVTVRHDLSRNAPNM